MPTPPATSLDRTDRDAARWFDAFNDASRLRIIRALAAGPLRVSDIGVAVGVPIVNASHHLSLLYAAGVLDRTPSGREIHYGLAEDVVVRKGAVTLTGPGGVTVTIPAAG